MSIFEYDQETHMKQEREESRELGRLMTLTKQTIKKLKKGLTAEDIADILEEDVDEIKKICKVAGKYAPDYDVDQICDELLQNKW